MKIKSTPFSILVVEPDRLKRIEIAKEIEKSMWKEDYYIVFINDKKEVSDINGLYEKNHARFFEIMLSLNDQVWGGSIHNMLHFLWKRSTIEENRKLISRLVYSKTKFTIQEIIDEYKAACGHTIIDGLQSIRSWIRGIEEFGKLRREGEYYVFIE